MLLAHNTLRSFHTIGLSRWEIWGSTIALILTAVWTLGTEVGAPGSAVVTNDAPRIELAEEVYDFGRVEGGRVVQHDFAFTNAGNQVLEIKDIVVSCGCTTIGEWNRKVDPGKFGLIPVQLNTTGLAGPTVKNIKLTCNDPAQPEIALYLKVNAYKQIDALPTVAAFVFGPDFQTNQTRVIWITNNMDETVKLDAPIVTNDTIKAELKTVDEGRVFQLMVTTIPPLPEGSTVVPVTLKTSSPRMPEVSVSAYTSVQPSISIVPPRLFLDAGPLKEAVTFNIAIQNKGTNALQLGEPAFPVKGVELKLTETQPGREFVLTVTFPVGFKAPPNQEVSVRMKSNRPSRPWVTLPVVQPEADDGGGASEPAAPASSAADSASSSPAVPAK